MANLAASLAASLGYDGIALAIHSGDHAVYPDTTFRFIRALEDVLRESTGDPAFVTYAPWTQRIKADIVATGARMGVPFEKTWSCYVGGNVHCGRCSTCIERRKAS
jgi:7-cyano-7-deazaguanine synthase